LAKIDISKTR